MTLEEHDALASRDSVEPAEERLEAVWREVECARLEVEVETGNADMRTAGDLAEALRRAADRIAEADLHGDSGAIRDSNGNSVGRWTVTQMEV